jgi:lipopolysaccharide biosynthesis protein
MKNIVRPIAIYLPQFHPIPENDEWWGKGFTEWTNVTKAKPLFKGHYQPHLPADLGFYDLRVPEIQEAQAHMARDYGIYGFCYYHYWFDGKKLLERPIENVLKNKKPDFPFCLFWANESWSRTWWDDKNELLIEQTYSDTDPVSHAQYLYNTFTDNRYIRINNRPVFIIYRPLDIPYFEKYLDRFKNELIHLKCNEPYLIASNSHNPGINYLTKGFDGILNFEPQFSVLPDFIRDTSNIQKFIYNSKYHILNSKLKIISYNTAKDLMENRQFPYKYYPCVFVSWDNSSRRGQKGIIMINQNSDRFKVSLQKAKEYVENNKLDDNLIFINSWNEWAEGNHLEPDLKYGSMYLEQIKGVFQ